jgi:hypothetical protein
MADARTGPVSVPTMIHDGCAKSPRGPVDKAAVECQFGPGGSPGREPLTRWRLPPVVDLDGAANPSDRALGHISCPYPSLLSRFLQGTEAPVPNIAVVGRRSGAQNNRALRSHDPSGLSARHGQGRGSGLGHDRSRETSKSEGSEDELHDFSSTDPLGSCQQAWACSVP